jgi:hypothetical protein
MKGYSKRVGNKKVVPTKSYTFLYTNEQKYLILEQYYQLKTGNPCILELFNPFE